MVASAQGLDVANFQGMFDWAAAKARIPNLAFGIYRVTEGLPASHDNSPDPTAKHNHDSIAAQGLHRGAYHFLHPDLNGAEQAQYFVSTLAQLGSDSSQMLFLDNERAGQSPAVVAACAQAFMHELAQLAPHNPQGVYTFINFANEGNCAGLGQYPLWLAFPSLVAPADPPPWHRWTFWQWGQRNGEDTDAFNGTVAQLQAWIESFLPQTHGPYRHVADGTKSLAQIAQARNTSVEHIAEVTAGALKLSDMTAMMTAVASTPLPAGFPYYTTNP